MQEHHRKEASERQEVPKGAAARNSGARREHLQDD